MNKRNILCLIFFFVMILFTKTQSYETKTIYLDFTGKPYSFINIQDYEYKTYIQDFILNNEELYDVIIIQNPENQKDIFYAKNIIKSDISSLFGLHSESILLFNLNISDKFKIIQDRFENDKIQFKENDIRKKGNRIPIQLTIPKNQVVKHGKYYSTIQLDFLKQGTNELKMRYMLKITLNVKKDIKIKLNKKYTMNKNIIFDFDVLKNTPYCLTIKSKINPENQTTSKVTPKFQINNLNYTENKAKICDLEENEFKKEYKLKIKDPVIYLNKKNNKPNFLKFIITPQ